MTLFSFKIDKLASVERERERGRGVTDTLTGTLTGRASEASCPVG